MSETAPAWDAFQREVLDALGHVVYVARDAAVSTHTADNDAPPLLRNLARAANVSVAALPPLPPFEQLRTPAAKRTLWPRLRALRKGASP
jgi:hypothetical protein